MNKNKMFGRGQALQSVMAQSSATRPTNKIRMENYTNEKIMQFVETLVRSNEEGHPAQSLPSGHALPSSLPLMDDKSEACSSFKNQRQWKDIGTSTSTRTNSKPEDSSSSVRNIVTDQYTYKEEDFPPL